VRNKYARSIYAMARLPPRISEIPETGPPDIIALKASKTYAGGKKREMNCIHPGSVDIGYSTPANGEISAGIGQMNHSDAGPKWSTKALPKIPSAIPKRKSVMRNGMAIMPYMKRDSLKKAVATKTITRTPIMLVTILERISPPTYSDIRIGVAKILRKFRDQTSSKNAIVTPCMIRMKKSHKRTAPRSTGTKLNPPDTTVLRYLVKNPQRTISTATQANSGNMREVFPFRR